MSRRRRAEKREVLPDAKVAPDVGHAFAVESVYSPNAMGFHVRNGGTDLPVQVWFDPTQRAKIFEYCPELTMIMEMRLKREACVGDDAFGSATPHGSGDLRNKMWVEALAQAHANAGKPGAQTENLTTTTGHESTTH